MAFGHTLYQCPTLVRAVIMSRSDPEAYITRPGYSGLSASLPLVQRKSQTERGVTRSNSSEQLASSRRIASREILFYSIYHSAFSIHRWYSCLFRRSILSSPLSVGKSVSLRRPICSPFPQVTTVPSLETLIKVQVIDFQTKTASRFSIKSYSGSYLNIYNWIAK
ncbi:hypothetical protein PCANC_14464 [Puccinia coronata f. sp. avenae]|uniref:Uncharacterized protein n=1 Tax=Puccinia coronata f. sp. avenae TaxID=200324 RepID=A0A2N5USG9_9BASI|nr:hypothetical protein PCANC_14464 [Puccinia coronata f. sp. avenae]